MNSPYSSLLATTVVPIAESLGYALVGNKYDSAVFGNAVVTFESARARAVLIKDRSFWSLDFSDKAGALEEVEISEWIEIIDNKAGDFSWRESHQPDSDQLSQLADHWKAYGSKIERLLEPHRIPFVQSELVPLRKRRIDEFLRNKA